MYFETNKQRATVYQLLNRHVCNNAGPADCEGEGERSVISAARSEEYQFSEFTLCRQTEGEDVRMSVRTSFGC